MEKYYKNSLFLINPNKSTMAIIKIFIHHFIEGIRQKYKKKVKTYLLFSEVSIYFKNKQ